MLLSLMIPSYRRCDDLERCLTALKAQQRLPDQVIVVVRDTDLETQAFLAQYNCDNLPIETATVTRTGVVAAMNAGLGQVRGEILCLTDDDAVPYPDWLARIEATFLQDDRIGGVGGKDWLYENGVLQTGEARVVGKLQWFGRSIGNHHLGSGVAREVDLLKGVNMSLRRAAMGNLSFDERLLGTGAQVHFEMSLCLAIKRAGWRLIYDPQIQVDHFRAQRFDEDQRNRFNPVANYNHVYNETVVLLDHLSLFQRLVFGIWAMVIGTRAARGIFQLLRFLPSEGAIALQRWQAATKGRWQAWWDWRRARSQNQWSHSSEPV
jgi:GT2 family glycosyltransferase